MIGHLLEYLLVQEGAYYDGYKIIAGKSHIDLFSEKENKAIEVKSRGDSTTPNIDMLSKEMKHMLEEGNIDCELCLCIIKKSKALFIIYQITKKAKKAKKEEIEGFA
jgi:hypothetical protein